MKLEIITHQMVKLAKAVGHFIKQESSKISETDVIEKGSHDLVSYVDKQAEQRLVEELGKIIPSSGFIAEEDSTLKEKGDYNWIIDPLDGTTNFVHGIPLYSVSIALKHLDEIVAGLVYEVNLDECFYAWKDGSAYLNQKKISVSKTYELDNTLLATGFPYQDYSLMSDYLDLFEDLMRNSRGIRRLGSAAVDLAYVACGRFDLFYEYGLKPWDVAAGTLIVQQAGGKVTDFKGGSDYIFGQRIIASNKILHKQFLDKVKLHFKDV